MTEDHAAQGHGPTHGSFNNSLVSAQSSETSNQSARNLMPPPPSLSPSPSHTTATKTSQANGRSLFSSYKTVNRLHPQDATVRHVSRAETTQDVSSQQGEAVYNLARASDSSPDVSSKGHQASDCGQLQGDTLPLITKSYRSADLSLDAYVQNSYLSPPDPLMPGGGHQALGNGTGPAKKLKPRPRLAHLLGRRGSVRGESGEVTPKSSRPRLLEPDDLSHAMHDPGLKTAPLQHEGDRSFREMVTSTIRNRSADRQRPAGSENGSIASSKEYGKSHSNFSSSLKDGSGAAFLSNLKSSGTKAADGIGKAGKGLFGKFARTGSSGEKATPADEHYVCTVITLPLVEQTRLTRISKRLEHSRDKTEFWMPALPWRCIEYVSKPFSAVRVMLTLLFTQLPKLQGLRG